MSQSEDLAERSDGSSCLNRNSSSGSLANLGSSKKIDSNNGFLNKGFRNLN